jgi:hypothetical protein
LPPLAFSSLLLWQPVNYTMKWPWPELRQTPTSAWAKAKASGPSACPWAYHSCSWRIACRGRSIRNVVLHFRQCV